MTVKYFTKETSYDYRQIPRGANDSKRPRAIHKKRTLWIR